MVKRKDGSAQVELPWDREKAISEVSKARKPSIRVSISTAMVEAVEAANISPFAADVWMAASVLDLMARHKRASDVNKQRLLDRWIGEKPYNLGLTVDVSLSFTRPQMDELTMLSADALEVKGRDVPLTEIARAAILSWLEMDGHPVVLEPQDPKVKRVLAKASTNLGFTCPEWMAKGIEQLMIEHEVELKHVVSHSLRALLKQPDNVLTAKLLLHGDTLKEGLDRSCLVPTYLKTKAVKLKTAVGKSTTIKSLVNLALREELARRDIVSDKKEEFMEGFRTAEPLRGFNTCKRAADLLPKDEDVPTNDAITIDPVTVSEIIEQSEMETGSPSDIVSPNNPEKDEQPGREAAPVEASPLVTFDLWDTLSAPSADGYPDIPSRSILTLMVDEENGSDDADGIVHPVQTLKKAQELTSSLKKAWEPIVDILLRKRGINEP